MFRQTLIYSGDGIFIDEAGIGDSLGLVRVDTAGAVLDTLPLLAVPSSGTGKLPPLLAASVKLGTYAPRLVYAAMADGSVWMASSHELRLFKRNSVGDTVMIIETDQREYRLSRDDEQAIEKALAPHGLQRSSFNVGRQVVLAIHVLADGHLMVSVAGEDEQYERVGQLFDVFDPAGRFLGTIETDLTIAFMEHARPAMAFQGDTLVAVIRGDLDVPYIVRGVIQRGVGKD